MADEKDREEIIVAEFHKKIKEAFEVFDHESNNTVDVREIGTIIRSLGCCPTEGELHDLIAEVEEEEPTGYIRFEKFLPVMTEILLERRYRPIPEDVLLRAFEVLDSAKRGFLTKDELIKYMTEEAGVIWDSALHVFVLLMAWRSRMSCWTSVLLCRRRCRAQKAVEEGCIEIACRPRPHRRGFFQKF
ncbi:dynein regulatory complex protein 8 isoform X2 [Papio anubis]|uniref:dynein regulatory complex protein 8 isoform X2 n=1 Tax=Papio anubis TaxID=9555 RepID=UPI0004F22B87|nr:dynein regulatory complex protein 8 isoform X2 [Papio anubis]